MSESPPASTSLGKRLRDENVSDAEMKEPNVGDNGPKEVPMEEDDDEDIGPMPMPEVAEEAVRKKRKGKDIPLVLALCSINKGF